MYELGYKAALKDVLRSVDAIPNEKPNADEIARFSAREENVSKRVSIAWAIHGERQRLKEYIHVHFDPSYEPEMSRINDSVRDMQ